MSRQRDGIWDASQCALLLCDYQENVLAAVFEQDRRVIELNTVTLAEMAVRCDIPVVLSTVGVEMGANDPTLPSLTAVLPDVEVIDRSQMNAWEDPAFVEAVKATGRTKLVMGGIVTSVCLAFPAVSALADGYEVTFIEDAVGDSTKESHDTAVTRLAHAGAVPNTTLAMMAEWFRDWKSPLADHARELWVPYREEWAALTAAPEHHKPTGLIARGGVRPGAH
jgi:nicotinamidase-related amidase